MYHHMVSRQERTSKILISFHIVLRVQASTYTPKEIFWNWLYLKKRKKTDAFYTESTKLVSIVLVNYEKVSLVHF